MQKGSIDMQAGRPGSKFTTKKYWRMSMQRYHSFSTAGSRVGPHTLYEGRLLISIPKNCFGEDGICFHIAILQGMSERLQRTGVVFFFSSFDRVLLGAIGWLRICHIGHTVLDLIILLIAGLIWQRLLQPTQ